MQTPAGFDGYMEVDEFIIAQQRVICVESGQIRRDVGNGALQPAIEGAGSDSQTVAAKAVSYFPRG